MNTIGFPISHKENEKRRALLPQDLCAIQNPHYLFFEKGYGDVLGISDEEYVLKGANIASREEVLTCDIICDPKIGDADYLDKLHHQTIFGWIHAVQNKDISDKIISAQLTAYEMADMFENGRHVFWRNNQLAGEAAIAHAAQCWGRFPYGIKVAVIGQGNTARGAIRILNIFGADVYQYNRRTEHLLREEIGQFDMIVNCVLWDTARTDHIIYRSDLAKMKKGSIIVDISCDRNGGIETSVPTTIDNPTYFEEGILHYVVDHTPALYYKTASQDISSAIAKYINELQTTIDGGGMTDILSAAKIVEEGQIVDQRIVLHQNRSL